MGKTDRLELIQQLEGTSVNALATIDATVLYINLDIYCGIKAIDRLFEIEQWEVNILANALELFV